MARGRKWFESHVKKFCLMQVGLLTVLLVAAVAVHVVCFPESRINGRGISVTVAYFFLLAVMNFMLYAFGKARLGNLYLFGLTVVLSLLFAFLSPSAGLPFIVQMLLFAAGECLFDAVYYRRVG